MDPLIQLRSAGLSVSSHTIRCVSLDDPSDMLSAYSNVAIKAIATPTDPDHFIVEVETGTHPDGSEVHAFHDNTGKRLWLQTNDEDADSAGMIAAGATIMGDFKSALFEIVNDGPLPSKGATGVSASGILAIHVASNRHTVVAKNVKFNQGKSVELNGLELLIEEIEEYNDWCSPTIRIDYSRKHDVIGIRIASSRNPNPVLNQVSSSISSEGAWISGFELSGRPESVDLIVDMWENRDLHHIPFEIKANLGLTD